MTSWANKNISRKPKINKNIINSNSENNLENNLENNSEKYSEKYSENNIIFDNLYFNFENIIQKLTIFIYDNKNTTFSNNIKESFQNKYNDIKIINNLNDILKSECNVLFIVTYPTIDDIKIIQNIKYVYIYINEYNLNNSTELFKLVAHFIFSSECISKSYHSITDISHYSIMEDYEKCEIMNTIFCSNIHKSLDFIYNKYSPDYDKLSNIIETYAIYFPQFHEIEENNYTFYKGYTDMINLKKAKKSHDELYTPLKGFLDFYDLKNQPYIVKNQIKLAKSFGIKGFSVYYYWFSENSITNNNMLMSNAIDNFFKDSYDNFDVFFIWANESWSNNLHFNVNSNNHVISNIYNDINFKKNINNLIKYFKHNNYKKIDNKPVIFLHNPDQLSVSELDLFYNLLTEICITHGFNGVEFAVCDRDHIYLNKYKTYLINPQGKSGNHITFNNDIYYTNYKNQVTDYIKNDNSDININGVLINYDNTARLFTHHINKHITRFYNSDINEFYILLNYCLNKYLYKKQSISKIFLINAWNEWGEKMTAEPSNEIGFLYLNTIQSSLLHLRKAYEQQKQSINNKIIVNDLNITKDALITFIIPTINRHSLINTLLSLKSQKEDNWKAIIIFDGVYPSDIRLLDLLSDTHFTYFSIDKLGVTKGVNHGSAGYVRNIGMNLVNTEWIGFVDDDDILLPNYTEKIIEEIRITPLTDLIIFRMIDKNKIIPPVYLKTIELGKVGISFCFKTELYRQGFKFKQSEYEDFNLIKDIKDANKKIVISPYTTYIVRNSNTRHNINSIRVIIN